MQCQRRDQDTCHGGDQPGGEGPSALGVSAAASRATPGLVDSVGQLSDVAVSNRAAVPVQVVLGLPGARQSCRTGGAAGIVCDSSAEARRG